MTPASLDPKVMERTPASEIAVEREPKSTYQIWIMVALASRWQ
jgi:hypothetical protein